MDSKSRDGFGSWQQQVPSPRKKSTSSRSSSGDSREINQGKATMDSRSRYEDGSRQQVPSPRKKSTSSRSSSGDSREINQGKATMDSRSRYEDGSRQQVPSPRKMSTSSKSSSGDSREINQGKAKMDSSSRYEDVPRQQLPSPQQKKKNSSTGFSGDSSDDAWSAGEEEEGMEGGMSVLDSAAVTNMVDVAGYYAMQLLLDEKGRQELRSRCSERLQEEHGVNVQYAEQAVLANLDWGIDGLEKAVKATNLETRAARLEHTEKMLQVAVLLDPKRTTAGVPNSYLSAWASYYMALVWKLRNNDRNAALHLLDVFLLEPFHARKTFVPQLWEELFRPHMANIEGWYRDELEQIMNDSPPLSSVAMFPIPKPRRSRSMDSTSHSRSMSVGSQGEFKDASSGEFKTSSRSGGGAVEQQQPVPAGGKERKVSRRSPSLAPDQLMRLELLNKLYQDSLDENTKQYAQYYKDWMVYEAADEERPAGAGDVIEPSFPRIINPSLRNPSSFTRLQREESTGQAGPSGRSSVSTLPTAVNGTFDKPDAGDVQVLQKRTGHSRRSSMDRDNLKSTHPRRTSMDRDSDSFTKDAQPRRTSMDRDSDNLTRAADPKRTSMDRDNDSFTKSVLVPKVDAFASKDGIGNVYQVPVGEEGGNGDDQSLDLKSNVTDGIAMDDQEDGISVTEVDKGAGVYLDGEQLTEDELLQVWEEISEGRISIQEAKDFINQLTDKEGQPLDFQKLSEFAEAVRAQVRDHQENQQVELPESPEPESVHNKYADSSQFDNEEEEEEKAEVKIRQEFDRPDSPDTLSRLNSLSSRSSTAPNSSRSNLLQVQLYTQEQPVVRPPKDFVCPITNQLFHDPVTLETGQTYERGAIKEWFDRGNTTCPITRQMLKNTKLPKTNYVLKRLVDNWKDDHPEYLGESTRGEATSRASSGRLGRAADGLEMEVYAGLVSPPSSRRSNRANILNDDQRPSRRVGQKIAPLPLLMGDEASSANLEALLKKLRSAVEILFRTEDLVECERAALLAAEVWVDSKCDSIVAANLSKAGVVEGLMEVLSSSKDDEVLRAVVCLFSDLISKDEFARHTILRADPQVESIVSVLKNARVPQAAVLVYLLKVPASQLSVLKVVPFLVSVVRHGQFFTEGTFTSVSISPKAAAVYILEQLVTTLDHRENMGNAEAIVRAEGVPSLMERLEAKTLEEKISAVAVLWSCLQSDGSCRMLMVQNLKMSNLINLFHNSKEQARTVAIFFLAELIRLPRRRVIEKVLKDVLEEGVLNSMHILMLHLQMSPLEHRPLVAGLLLQLDLLADPQKHSVYREEALEALVHALHAEDKTKVQLEAAKALASLSGRYSNKGKSATEASLLKAAGFEDEDTHSTHSPKLDHRSSSSDMSAGPQDEKKAADDWDRRMAMAVLGSGKSLIEALGEALPSKSIKIARPCLVATAWLTSSLRQMSDTSLLSHSRTCFLSSLVSILQTGRDSEMRVLACLSLHNLTDDAAGIQQLVTFSKNLLGPLRRLRRHTWTARKLLETLAANPFTDVNIDVWEHGEVGQLDTSRSGETRVVYYFRGYLYSGHSDASIKSWSLKGRTPQMVQEVREHNRAVLCLTGLEAESKLFSGSADKTVRIWLAQDDDMRCVQIVDAKEAVHCVAVNSSFICIVPQGVGLKVFDSKGSDPRVLNTNKHVQSITFGENRIYCGCTDSSIQEIDPLTGTSATIQSGVRSLRGKKAIYSLKFSDDQLVAGGTNVEGIAVKMWNIATRSLVASIATQIDVRVIAMSEDLLYLASNFPTGVVEVWLLEKNQKVASFSAGSKILSLTLVGDTLYTGSADGIIRAWALV